MTELTPAELAPDLNHLSSYHFELPNELIARAPLLLRSDSRMLIVDPRNNRFCDSTIRALPDFVQADDVMVFNNTRVLAARLFAKKLSGGAIEILIERVIDTRTVLAQMGVSKKPRPNQEILLEDGTRVVVSERRGLFWVLKLMGSVLWPEVIAKLGHMPLPPYLARVDELSDRERYQTVYAKAEGSVAAPTAGLHFDAPLLAALDAKGTQRHELTLHVGAGTFAPVRVADLDAHEMHSERIEVPSAVQTALAQAKANGAKRIAVGTTSLRALESLPISTSQVNQDYVADTTIFIRPGYSFQQIDALLTNFHLPQSTLLVLVCALGGHDLVLRAYAHAIAQKYRFYSYGDAMLILPGALPDTF
jgi:S-adenosylmethionine:tRNA ribosyltransferase-isomerase